MKTGSNYHIKRHPGMVDGDGCPLALRDFLFEQDWNQQEFATKINLTTGQLSRLERHIANPSLETFAMIERVLNIPDARPLFPRTWPEYMDAKYKGTADV